MIAFQFKEIEAYYYKINFHINMKIILGREHYFNKEIGVSKTSLL